VILTFILKKRVDSVILPEYLYLVPIITDRSSVVIPNSKFNSSSRSSTVQDDEVSKSNTNSHNLIVYIETIEISSIGIVKEKS
jgi:hypothetical protein